MGSNVGFHARSITTIINMGQCCRKPEPVLPKAAETNKDKATSALARLLARKSSLSLLVGGGGGRRLALAGRRLATRCVLVTPGGRAWRSRGLHAWWPALASLDEEILSTPHLTGSGRLLMARRRLLLLGCGGHVVRRGWRS